MLISYSTKLTESIYHIFLLKDLKYIYLEYLILFRSIFFLSKHTRLFPVLYIIVWYKLIFLINITTWKTIILNEKLYDMNKMHCVYRKDVWSVYIFLLVNLVFLRKSARLQHAANWVLLLNILNCMKNVLQVIEITHLLDNYFF